MAAQTGLRRPASTMLGQWSSVRHSQPRAMYLGGGGGGVRAVPCNSRAPKTLRENRRTCNAMPLAQERKRRAS